MTFVDVPPPTDAIPAGQNPIEQAFTNVNELLVKLGLATQPKPGTPSAPPPAPKINWPDVQAQLSTAWPGYAWPASYNSELVAALFSDVLGRLGAETQYSWETGIALQLEINLLYHYIVVLQTNVSALEGSAPSVASIPGLTGDLANLQTEVQKVAATAWSNLWALYNNQVVPLVGRAEATAWSNLWGLWNNQVQPGLAAVSQEAFNNLWSLYNNQVVPLVAGEANMRAGGDAQLSVALDAETARAQQTENTLHGQIANETARATGVESNILGVAIPSAVAALATQVETELAPLRTDVETCLAPLCDTVTPNAKQLGNLGGLLKALEGLGIAAVLAGLVAEAVSDPDAASSAVIEIGGWMPTFAVDLVNAL